MSPLFTHGSLFGPLWCKWMSSDIPPSNINVPPFYWGWAQYVSNPLLSTHTSLVCEKLFKIKFQMGISKVISRSKKKKQNKKNLPLQEFVPPHCGVSLLLPLVLKYSCAGQKIKKVGYDGCAASSSHAPISLSLSLEWQQHRDFSLSTM